MTSQQGTATASVEAPALDTRELRRTLGQYATGVIVVTAGADGEKGGMTANSFASVSLDPPLVLWSIQKQTQSFPVFMRATHFTINVLARDQIDISQRFAKSGHGKFEETELKPAAGGSWQIPGATAVFECRREYDYDGGDHIIMVGRVERFNRSDREPLVFRSGRYAVAVEHPDAIASVPEDAGLRASLSSRYLVLLLSRVHNRLVRELEHVRDEAGLQQTEIRVLGAAILLPGRTVAALSPLTYLGQRQAEDIVENLRARGLVSVDDGAIRVTPAGERLLDRIYLGVASVEEALMADLPKEDVAAFRRVLRYLDDSAGLTGEAQEGN